MKSQFTSHVGKPMKKYGYSNKKGYGNYPNIGFTLVELLVVIAIIALLMGILLPTLGRARKLGYRIVCMSNVRRLGVSMMLYLGENNDNFPPDRIRDNSQSVSVGPYIRKKPRWIWYLNEGMGYVINPYKYDSQEAFSAALEMDNDYFLCPSLKNYEYVRNIRNGAYGYNYQYLSSTRIGPSGSYANYPNKSLRIKSPVSTVVFCDSRGAGIPHGEHAYLVDPPKMAVSKGAKCFSPKSPGITPIGGANRYSPVDARHLGKANTVFLDGHSEALTYEELGYEVDQSTKRPVEKSLTEIGGGGNNHLWGSN